MTENEIKTKLDMLADMRARADLAESERQRMIAESFDPLVIERLETIELNCKAAAQLAQEQADILEAEVKQLVAAHGTTIKSTFLQAVWNKPRVSWDGKQLEGYAAAHPEIRAFRSEGKPTVTIRSL